jgi:hypothetical protein
MRELRERAEPILKIICLLLAVLVLVQLAGIFVRWNPFRGVAVPALPSLTASTNLPPGGAHGTNLAAAATAKGTNLALSVTGANSNSVLRAETGRTEANSVVRLGTNGLSPVSATNTNTTILAAIPDTNSAHQIDRQQQTNSVARLETNSVGTNIAVSTNAAAKGTNVSLSTSAAGTNATPATKPETKNARATPAPEMAGMNFNPFQPPGKRGGDLSPAMQTRISRIVDSEILGPVMRPLPMGLLGIAGEFAFLRSANGQTGLVKEGDSLDDLKLLRIGINRVLIEQGGQKKELTIFSGYGGHSLLPTNTPDENHHP